MVSERGMLILKAHLLPSPEWPASIAEDPLWNVSVEHPTLSCLSLIFRRPSLIATPDRIHKASADGSHLNRHTIAGPYKQETALCGLGCVRWPLPRSSIP